MEFQEFCKEKERMCKFWRKRGEKEYCYGCGINQIRIEKDMGAFTHCNDVCLTFPEETEQIVEQWVKEHPIVTNADKFREIFGIEIDTNANGDVLFYGLRGMTNEEWLKLEYKELEEADNGNDR